MPNPYGGNIGFGPYSAEQSEALRKQRIAEMLMKQGMQAPQAQQGGRFAVPISPLQGLAQVGSAAAGGMLGRQAGEQASGIAQKQQAERAQALARALQQAQGSPQPDASMGGGPAMPADPVGAMGTLAQSQDPSLMQMGAPAINMQQQQMRQQQEQAFRAQQAEATRASSEQQRESDRAFREQQAAAARQQQGDMARLTASLRPQQQKQPIAPKGYRFTQDGQSLEAIPGGPEDKTQMQAGKTNAAIQKADTVIGKVDQALEKVGFMTTGLTGKVLGNVPGTEAYDLDKLIDTVKANIGFSELQAMREASPTGGALGQVAVMELQMLQATIASLEHGQSEPQLRSALDAVKTHFGNWKQAVQQAQGAGGQPTPQSAQGVGNLTPQEQQELNQLRQRFGRVR